MEPIATETRVPSSVTGSLTGTHDPWLSVEVVPEHKPRKQKGRMSVEKYAEEVATVVHDAKQVGGTHYLELDIQPWDAMQSWMSQEEFVGFLRGNVIKYVARSNKKGGIEDLKKALHYLEKLVEVYGA